MKTLEYNRENDAVNIALVLWKSRKKIFLATFVSAMLSLCLALYLPNVFRSEALLSPVSNSSTAGITGLASQLGGLASLAGINIGGGDVDATLLALEVANSREFLTNFIEKYNLVVPLMASNGWDNESNQLTFDKSIYDTELGKWTREPKNGKAPKPTSLEAVDRFREILLISQDKKSSFVKISIENYSPYLAQKWTELFVMEINSEMRKRDLLETKEIIKYLQNQIDMVKIAEMRTVLYQLIEDQTKTLMIAEVRQEYAFKIIDPPIVPELKDKPKRPMICVFGTLLGFFLSIVIVLISDIIHRVRCMEI